MSNNPYAENPFSTPQGPGPKPPMNSGSNADIVAPGIGLIIVGSLGILVALFGVISALFIEPTIDPNLPPQWQEFQKGASGPLAAIIQGLGLIAAAVVTVGGVCMVRRSNYALAMTGSIIAILNCVGGCCIIGLPVGIWAIVMLSQESVKRRIR